MSIGTLDAITKKAEPKQEHEHQHQQFSCVHPLTPDSKFPCIIRLIQDDTPMGRYNKYSFGNPTEYPELWETQIAEEVIAELYYDRLTEPMKSTVLALLERQTKESQNGNK